jgi:hypothetical protein
VRRFSIPLAAALVGVASLALLFPRFDPAASLRAVLTRDQAIAKTRQLASANRLNTDGWKALAVEALDTPTGPLTIRTELIAPGKKGSFQAAWFPDGRLAWSRLPGQPAGDAVTSVHVNTVEPEDQAKVHVHVDDKLRARDKLSYRPVAILDGLWRFLAVVYFVVAAVRRRLRYRLALILAGLMIVWAAASFWGGTQYDKGRLVKASVDTMVANGAGDIDVNVGESAGSDEPSRASAVFWMFLFTAMGISLRAVGNQRKWYAVELLTGRRIFNRAVGSAVADGLLYGMGIAAIPYWIAASGAFHGSVLVFRSVETLAAPFPASVAWDLSVAALAAGVFGFAAPLTAKLRPPILRWGIVAAIGMVAVGHSVTPFSTPGANLFTAAVLFAAFLLVYLKIDLLATIAAMVAAKAVLAPCVLLAQPGGSIRALALPILLTWGVVLAGALHAALRGKEEEELPSVPAPEPAGERTNKTGRMRLEAEFEVARKAQQDALPPAAPAVEGYSIAGSCEPAQQVGGDLYDYFPLADGRLGIAVADVSGKGVPAALYMMVTKGLLAAVTRDSSDLAYILQQINRHLYSACKKKVFVTLTAVALDAPARRLQHGRAGHNPIVWRRAARGETVVLKPPGVGLGLTAGDRFNRILKIEELQLEPGDAVVLYSDGITEAMNDSLELFGDERLIRAVESTDGQPAEESRAAIIRELAAFTDGAPARDDVTLVVLRVAGEGVVI